MNFQRGFRRLFLVTALCWYGVGGLLLWDSWRQYRHRADEQKRGFAECLTLVTPGFEASRPSPPPGYLLDSPATPAEACSRIWPRVDPANEWMASIGLAGFPWLIYLGVRILVWIARGFRTAT